MATQELLAAIDAGDAARVLEILAPLDEAERKRLVARVRRRRREDSPNSLSRRSASRP